MIIAIIPAKGGSTRLPNKNMHLLFGKPMLQYAIGYTKASKKISKIYISTDDNTIAEYAKSQEIEVILRSESLGGETPLIDVYQHALKTLELDNIKTVVGVQPDHPDRNISLDESLKYFEENNLDLLYSKEANGNKNGAHYIMNANRLMYGNFQKIGFIIDDCTNVHYLEDLKNAENNIRISKS